MLISQTTSEREQETRELFEQLKPFLDKGFSYNRAVHIVLDLPDSTNFSHLRWYLDVIEYGTSQGYPLKDYMRSKKNGMGV